MTNSWIARFWRSFSTSGLLVGTAFFVASMTPTLTPRSYLIQGIISGWCFAVGYGIGVLCRRLWGYMELPLPVERSSRIIKRISAAVFLILAATVLWLSAGWQNSIRKLMEMEPLPSAQPLEVCAITLIIFLLLIALARGLSLVSHAIAMRMRHLLPWRVARVIGYALTIVSVWAIANGVLVRYMLHVADASFASFDQYFEADKTPPVSPLRSGSAASSVGWEDLGRTGRAFVASGPTASEISALGDGPALEPIRVYVGLAAAETPERRAHLALDELKRTGAFRRSALIVVTPTGTGWIDPAAIDTLEYLCDGDVASVAVQYSYLSSPLSLLMDPEYGKETSQALLRTVYEYWATLLPETRPKLYLHGLSLGALNSENSFELYEMLGDPIQGALWSGPPFQSGFWRSVMERRNPGSPAWLPQFRSGSFVRFMNQKGDMSQTNQPWGPARIVYLQYASDPVTFFDYRDFYRRPDWLDAPRGPDVSPEFRWYPVVTGLQLAFDMAVATSTPVGYGHVFAPEHYIDAWLVVLERKAWTTGKIARLKQYFVRQRQQ